MFFFAFTSHSTAMFFSVRLTMLRLLLPPKRGQMPLAASWACWAKALSVAFCESPGHITTARTRAKTARLRPAERKRRRVGYCRIGGFLHTFRGLAAALRAAAKHYFLMRVTRTLS